MKKKAEEEEETTNEKPEEKKYIYNDVYIRKKEDIFYKINRKK